MIKHLKLDVNTYESLISYCKEKGIEFLSTPFDIESLRLLILFVLRVSLEPDELKQMVASVRNI